MIQLSFVAPCEDYHKAAYHDAVLLALGALSAGRYIPWKNVHKRHLTNKQLQDQQIRDFFKDLYDEESLHNSLTCGKQLDMERVISSAGLKYDALTKEDKAACGLVLKAILPYEEFKLGRRFKVDQNQIELSDDGHWGGVEYLKCLGVRVCPYCNIDMLPNSTNLQYDHYLEKDKFPYLRLNLYNLVPSCPNCNQYRRKKIKIHDFVTYPYPYRDSIDKEAKFDLEVENLEVLTDDTLPVVSDMINLKRRDGQPNARSVDFLEKMEILKEYKNSQDVIERINNVKENAFYLHGEVQADVAKQIGKYGVLKTYSRVFGFPFDRRRINQISNLKVCLDMVNVFSPDLKIVG